MRNFPEIRAQCTQITQIINTVVPNTTDRSAAVQKSLQLLTRGGCFISFFIPGYNSLFITLWVQRTKELLATLILTCLLISGTTAADHHVKQDDGFQTHHVEQDDGFQTHHVEQDDGFQTHLMEPYDGFQMKESLQLP